MKRALLLIGIFLLAASLLLVGAQASAQDQVILAEGTIDFALGDGPDLSSQAGKPVKACVVYDPTVPQDAETMGDPNIGNFSNATVWMRIQLPDAGIDVSFEPVLEHLGVVVDNAGIPGTTEIDELAFVADGPLAPVSVQGHLVVGGEFGIAENTILAASPDMVTTKDSLPLTPLDLDTPGSFSLAVFLFYASETSTGIQSTSFTVLDPATDPTFCPEPASGLMLLAGVSLLGVLYRRRASNDPGLH